MDNIKTFPIPCQGGLRTNLDPLTQSAQFPGSSVTMINYEPALRGGYRRISGFTPDYGVVPGETAAPVLGAFVFDGLNSGIFACRKPASGNNYFHYWNGSSWTTPTTTGAPTMVGVSRVRFSSWSWSGPRLIMTDGINPAATWDGTTYSQITHATAPSAPKYSETFGSHMFLAGDPADPYNLYFSAPLDETEFSPGAGAGVVNVGFDIIQIKAFRNTLFIFGNNRIKRLNGTSAADFTVSDVTNSLGCLSSDSVIEFNGDLLFLSPDGMRPISATERIGDIELATVSKPVQTLFDQYSSNEDLKDVTVLSIRRKSQFRLFFPTSDSLGLIGALRLSGPTQAPAFEFSQLIGIDVYCGSSGYIADEEFVIHGDSNGSLHRQESGQNFNGFPIFSVFQTPYLHMDDPLIRKNYYSTTTFMLSEGTVEVDVGISYDYGTNSVENPTNYTVSTEGAAAYYGSAAYDVTDRYDGDPSPVRTTRITGSGNSIALTYVTAVDQPSHTIQALAVEYGLSDRR